MGDQDGLIGKSRFASLTEEQMSFARSDLPDGLSLEDAMDQIKPELILGLSGKRGTISEQAIRSMASHTKRPIVMPLSNPTSSCEITPEEAYLWTDGRAIVATGSPFDAVTLPSGQVMHPSQCNNMYIFPGVGLGASVAAAETIPDSMLYQSAVRLSQMTSQASPRSGTRRAKSPSQSSSMRASSTLRVRRQDAERVSSNGYRARCTIPSTILSSISSFCALTE